MPRDITLLALLNRLRGELRLSLNPAHNAQVRDTHILKLQAQQERLWADYDWPHLRVHRFIRLQRNQRYYAPPEGIAIDRIESVEVKFGGDWRPLGVNINAEHMSAYDSDAGETSWPVERWRIGEGERIEVWPVPAENGDGDSTREGQLKVWGIRNLRPLVADDDRCDLDSELLVLFVTADLLVPVDKEEATRKLAAAEARYLKMRGNLTPSRSFKLFGGAEVAKRVVRGPPTIHYRDRETG